MFDPHLYFPVRGETPKGSKREVNGPARLQPVRAVVGQAFRRQMATDDTRLGRGRRVGTEVTREDMIWYQALTNRTYQGKPVFSKYP